MSLGKLVEEFDQAIATASNLLGHSVLVPGTSADLIKWRIVWGARFEATIKTELIYRDADTNSELFRDELGPKGSGLVGFKWDDIPQEILENNKRIKIEAWIDSGNGPEQLSPSIYSKVISASVGAGDSKQVLLNIEDYGELDVSSAVNFR